MMLSVPAVSVGCAVPRPHFEARVHSVFHNSVNLRGPGESLLLTLLFSGGTDLPQGIRLAAAPRLALQQIHAGMAAICADDILTIGQVLRVDLRPARGWECDLYSLDLNLAEAAVKDAWRQAWATLQSWRTLREFTSGQPHGFPSHPWTFRQHVQRAIDRMLTATTDRDLTGMEAVADLIGAGPGLTPSGDDLVTGYLAGLWCSARRKPARREFLWALAELVIRAAARTNDIGRTYLCLAARGQVSSRLLKLGTAICRGYGAARVVAAAKAALTVGHTSGIEGVHGMLLGLAAWDDPGLLRPVTGSMVA